MKLHTFIGSPNCHKVEAVISHLGLEVEIQRHDSRAGDLRKPEFLALNPNGQVPLLEDRGFVLSESNAIMQYLADKASDSSLFPRDPQLRAEVARWQFWELAHFNGAFRVLVIETVIKPLFKRGPTIQALVDVALADLARFAPVLEQHLRGRDFMVGEGITLADYSVIALEAYRSKAPFDWSPYPRSSGYFERMRLVEHWHRTAPPELSVLAASPRAA
jgi:glutathione S-transferase